MNPSLQQSAILDLVQLNEAMFKERGYTRDNILVTAKAGAGKTTLLMMVIEQCVRRFGLSVCYTMFNKSTVEEMVLKCQAKGFDKTITDHVRTANSFGHQAYSNWRRGERFTVESGKVKLIYRELFRGHPTAWRVESQVSRLVSSAKTNGMGIRGIDIHAEEHGISVSNPMWEYIINHFALEIDDGLELDFEWLISAASQVLEANNKKTDMIDFDDQIYLSLLFNAPFRQYDYVLVDEFQDTNIVKRALYKRMLKPGGCLMGVGDRNQAVFGFTGADNDSIDVAKTEFKMTEMPLSVCYRCARRIVQLAQTWVPDIEPANNAPEGNIIQRPYQHLITDLTKIDWSGNDAILCRKNAPNMRLCFALLRQNIGCRVEGKDIGHSFVRTIDNLSQGEQTNLRDVQQRLIEFEDYEIRKALSKADDYAADIARDRCSTLQMLVKRGIEQGLGVEGLKKFIYSLFSDATDPKTPKDVVTLSSVHKAKGKEWNRVFLLGRQQLMPSQLCKTSWEREQELNLIYVAVTRAKKTLIEITNLPE